MRWSAVHGMTGMCGRSAFEETKHELLAVEGHKALLSDPSAGLLQAKLALRAPYITPLNILQVCSLLPSLTV